jgi:crotonobetainyl-CoA:carnitine CoA-transferase CaiB-like acyl-CoA transferase
MDQQYPLTGIRVLELGSRVTTPYIGKLFTDAGAEVLKIESPAGDPFRRWSASRTQIPENQDSAWWRFLNAGKRSVVLDLETPEGRESLFDLIIKTDLVLDDHLPEESKRLGITAHEIMSIAPSVVVASLTHFGTSGPWANRPANDFTLQALVGATENRGIPGMEPTACGGDLGDFVAASLAAPAILATTLAAKQTGEGTHLDISQYEAMMLAFQTYRPIFDSFAPDFRPSRQIEIPSVEPAKDGWVGYCTITGQQWQDFCSMIGADDWIGDENLGNFHTRMEQRDKVWEQIWSFTKERTVDELVELAAAFRIPVGPIGTGDKVATFDHFTKRGVFDSNPHGFIQPRPPYQFTNSKLAPVRTAPTLGEHHGYTGETHQVSGLEADTAQPLAGIKVLDLSAFWAGPVATNLLRVLGADLIKIESHIRLDGMRWASGLPIPIEDELWEWSPVYHGANAGKHVINLDLNTDKGIEVAQKLIADADVVIENYSPRVTEGWGFTWERIHQLNDRTIFVRVPAYGLDGPWRDRVGFAMNMEQVSGLANRTGHPDGPPLVPRGPVDTIAGMHAVFATVLALTERTRTGKGQLVEVPLIEGALQAAAEQVIEYSAYEKVLTRLGNRAPVDTPQGLYRTEGDDEWLALSIQDDQQWEALIDSTGAELDGFDRLTDIDAIDGVIGDWAASMSATEAAELLWNAGIPAAPCMHFNDSGRTPQHDARGFIQSYEHPITGQTPYLSYPFHLNGTHLPLGGPAPTLGQHTKGILANLGFSVEEIDELESTGVIGDWPAGIPR